MKLPKKPTVHAVGIVLLSASAILLAHQTDDKANQQASNIERIARDTYKSLVTLPQYGVFDHLHFAIQGNTVILRGQASRPTLKSSAENVVKRIQGVGSVRNEIEVLPLSPNDDRIRAAAYAQIYNTPSLSRYTNNRGGGRFVSPIRRATGITNDPPIGWHAIHIIVKNGNVRLVGVVDNSGDLAMAEMRANMLSGVFSVDNDLLVSSKDDSKRPSSD